MQAPKKPLTVKVSSKNQIAVPAEARQKLDLKPGDQLLVDIQDGMIILIPRPRGLARHLAGLYKEVWRSIDAKAHIDSERDAWEA